MQEDAATERTVGWEEVRAAAAGEQVRWTGLMLWSLSLSYSLDTYVYCIECTAYNIGKKKRERERGRVRGAES